MLTIRARPRAHQPVLLLRQGRSYDYAHMSDRRPVDDLGVVQVRLWCPVERNKVLASRCHSERIAGDDVGSLSACRSPVLPCKSKRRYVEARSYLIKASGDLAMTIPVLASGGNP